LLGYSRFSAAEFASAAYSFRAGGDAINSMRDEVVLKAGEDVYFKLFMGTRNRWGDYSNTLVDPVNDVDLWTIQEYAAPQVSSVSRWGTWWGKIIPSGAPPPPPTFTFSNTNAITINDATAPAAATPYPSNIVVSGLSGTITKVTVKLKGFSHTFPDDVDILLVGPTGTNLILMSDVGSGFSVSGLDLTFDDLGLSLPDSSTLSSGTFRPTDFPGTGTESFPSPAPAASANPLLSAFDGTDPNGTWSLYVVDDEQPDSGSISMGWEITIEVPASARRRVQITSE
ncbi:MAG: hypothetical protein ACRD2R_04875, partial [Terriglobales bacterium]